MSPVQGYGGASGRRYLLAWAWLPLLLTVVVRTGWLAAYPVDPLGAIDPEGFHLLAVNLLDGKGFAIGWEPPLCPTAVRTPLYPLFVAGMYALLGRLPERVVLLQVLLEVLTTALVMALVRELQLGRGAAVAESSRRRHHGHRDFLPGGGMFLAGMLYAVNGLTPRFTGYLYAETFLLPLLSGALLLSLRTLRKPGTERSIPAGWAWGLVLLT
ncbi:MAG: hypothetical protein JXC32_22485, partial [Anaerolineae bacterium]|nr:hypothetical protein [Anaerolineae bacterium]